MYSAYKLNKQGDNIQPCYTSFPSLEPARCSMSGSNCFFLTCIQISQEADQLSITFIKLVQSKKTPFPFSLMFECFIVKVRKGKREGRKKGTHRKFNPEVPLGYQQNHKCYPSESTLVWVPDSPQTKINNLSSYSKIIKDIRKQTTESDGQQKTNNHGFRPSKTWDSVMIIYRVSTNDEYIS